MGRIKKAAGPKHEATVSPATAEFVTRASTLPVSRLPEHLKSFPRRWPFPKGDLYHWIPLFNRFDSLLEQFNTQYGLQDGPQTRPFGRNILLRGIAEESEDGTITPESEEVLDTLGYSSDGDRELVEVILTFSRRLLENCGNRSLYSSSERLGHLLNTTSLSLLATALQLAVRLAQRYHASRQRGPNGSQHLNNALLSSHYNIDLEKVQKLANPFPRSQKPSHTSGINSTPSSKAKEKLHLPPASSSPSFHPSDLLALSQDTKQIANGSTKHVAKGSQKDKANRLWEGYGDVTVSFYQISPASKEDQKSPPTPTPARRPSALSRPSQLSSSDESGESSFMPTSTSTEGAASGGMKLIHVPHDVIASKPIEDILKENLDGLPKDSQYELLNKVRSAYAITSSLSTRQQLVAIRLLAITNVTYIYPDIIFQQKVLQQDSDEPRRLQLAYQLADLVHPPGNGVTGIPAKLQAIALMTLEALAKQKLKAADVLIALNVNVNHGVLFYILRKGVAEMATGQSEDETLEGELDDRQEALFALLEVLPSSGSRTTETLIGAGIFDILVEVLNLRTQRAERCHPKVLTFLSTFLWTAREAMQSFANAKGLDAISDLLDHQVQSSLIRARNGEGLPKGFRTRVIDYEIPYFQQQALRMVFKLVTHMMTNGPGNLDRLLRNLIDSPQLLGGLRTVILNPKVFGSSVWAGAINIMSTFIHNEPTSYAVISEAGLTKGFLQTIMLRSGPQDPVKAYLAYIDESDVAGSGLTTVDPSRILSFMLDKSNQRLHKVPFTQQILPASDAILSVPQAFGAICLNPAGTQVLLESGGINSFFKIFESDDHIRTMAADRGDLPRLLGSSFDELVRHHPNLKMPVMIAIMNMIERIQVSLDNKTVNGQHGTTLWLQHADGKLLPAGSTSWRSPDSNEDVNMGEASITSTAASVIAETGEKNDQDTPDVSSRLGVAMNFLAGFFENHTLCSFFVEAGGAKYVLDTATAPSLPYDFNVKESSQSLAKVIHMMVEQKTHLVLPLLLTATQRSADSLSSLYEHVGDEGFFARYTDPRKLFSDKPGEPPHSSDGTDIAGSLLNINTLCNILFEVFSGSIFSSRAGHSPFALVNLADKYRTLIKSLGLIHRVCVWEEILLHRKLPDHWREATKMAGLGMGSDEADEIFGFLETDSEAASGQDGLNSDPNVRSSTTSNNTGGSAASTKRTDKATLAKDEKTAHFKNVKTLRHLLSQVPSVIVLFSQNLGKNSLPKTKRHESYSRHNSSSIAATMADACLEQLSYEPPVKTNSVKDRYAYWIVALTSISSLMIDSNPMDRQSSQILTLLLQAFKNAKGLEAIGETLLVFLDEIKASNAPKDPKIGDRTARMTSAFSGIRIILGFYEKIIMSKAITDATQTHYMTSKDTEKGQPTYFSPGQFLVELRVAVLPVVRSIWESDFVDKAADSNVKSLIEILRTILEGSDEQGAFKRSDNIPVARKVNEPKPPVMEQDKVKRLHDQGYNLDLVREALYRCMNSQPAAQEYCQAYRDLPEGLRNPIPEYDKERGTTTETTTPPIFDQGNEDILSSGSVEAVPPDQPANIETGPALEEALDQVMNSAQGDNDLAAPPPAPGAPTADIDPMAMSIDDLPRGVDNEGQGASNLDELQRRVNALNELQAHLPGSDQARAAAALSAQISAITERVGPSQPVALEPLTSRKKPPVTIDDLNEQRAEVRKNLIDRALDVVNVHHDDVTFELADLINAGTSMASDPKTMRSEVGETLVQSLVSLQMEEDFRPAGKKIASYANLLALVLQDKNFYEATVDQLLESFEFLLGFIKVPQNQPSDEPCPWIGQILLVLEKLLSEDVQPAQIQWSVPADGKMPEDPVAGIESSLVRVESKMQLFEAIIDILPRIGKDESLALSIVRTLVILTRSQSIASRLSEKRNIQRLFVMVKQLSGMRTDKLPSTFMLLLRHMIEDEDIIRQIMRSEIMARFETRPGRQTDTTSYVKQMYDLVIRSPKLFVEITNEKLEIARYESNQRPQTLQLKAESKTPEADAEAPMETSAKAKQASTEATDKATGNPTSDEVESSVVETSETVMVKHKSAEIKAPVVEHPSGVIHYLLYELLSYKDVEDKDPSTTKEAPAIDPTEPPTDAELAAAPSPISARPSTPTNTEPTVAKKPEKPEFKPTEHPIYVYRCFILECLAELLHCYNRTKIEFINFSRKADPQAMTPSKPRSGVLNYLLNDVIPVGTLGSEETIAYRKKNMTSNWAMSAIVSLCLRTNENGHAKKQGSIEEDEDSDLLFVRKFVLEHALKAYKDAMTSEEHADIKYARLLDLADLFNRLLQGRIVPPPAGSPPDGPLQKSIAKLMFEKNFILALTSSIADIDLNFPGSKRAIKYILKPLKSLTSTAVTLSQEMDLSTSPGQTTEDDDISTAGSSVSSEEGDREETPDLFRNSTLGMFEPRNEEENSSSDSDEDEEMYEDEYGEEMDYEDGMDRDEDEIISDEDDDLGEAGPIEGLPGDRGMDVEVVIDEDDEPSDDENDDEDDQDDSEDDMDDDNDDIEIVDEVTGDAENDSLADGDDEGWQDEDENEQNEERYIDEDFVEDPSQEQDPPIVARDIVHEFGGAEAALQRLEGLDDGHPDLRMDVDPGRYMEDLRPDEEDDDEDEDDEDGEEDMDDDDVIYQPEYDDDDAGDTEAPFGWDLDDEGITMPRLHHHHHHHHPRRLQDPWTAPFPGSILNWTSSRDPPLFRSHRSAAAPRQTDDNTNPLLQHADRSSSARPSRGLRSAGIPDLEASLNEYFLQGSDGGRPRGIMGGESPIAILHELLANIDQRQLGFSAVGGRDGAVHLTINAGGPDGGLSALPRDLQMRLNHPHRVHHASSSQRDDNRPAFFQPAITIQRWKEEASLLYGTSHLDKAMLVVTSLFRVLVPPAINKKNRQEQELKRLQEAAEKRKREEEEAEEQRKQEEKEKTEREEREAAAAREAEAAAAAHVQEEAQSTEHTTGETTEEDVAMEGVDNTDGGDSTGAVGGNGEGEASESGQELAEGTSATIGPSEERVTTTIRGSEVDISGLGIDLAYLDALPEDIREEVLMSQLAIQRSEAQAAGQEPTDISREFLEALPPEIREELLQQEAQDRRRREREEARRRQQAANPGAARGPEEMDPASFLASLDPHLRQHVLMEQDEEMLSHLPEEIAAEARALGGSHHRFAGIGRGGRAASGLLRHMDASRAPPQPAVDKVPKRKTVQMLDKAGVATLLRLMFIPQQGSSKMLLNAILHDVSKNSQNRAEVVSLLLSILQDGSADVNAVERSFAHLSLRAKQPAPQKTPQPLKRSLTGPIASAANSMEATPLMVIQQCLSALNSLTSNDHVRYFFITEHEISSGMKSKANRKGKAKDTRATKFALNALLSLLDRKLIMESSSCMDQLSSLLQAVTHPLMMLLKKAEEEKSEKPKAVEAPLQPDPAAILQATVESDQPTAEAAEAAEAAPYSTQDNTASTNGANAHTDRATEQQEAPPPGTETEASEDKAKDENKKGEEAAKKTRTPAPPVVPEDNLRLVVNILAARECSAKTFRETLSTINNLSGIPGARDIFGKGLIEQAQDLGQLILRDLDELVPQIRSAESNTEIQGMALAKFSPGSSDQAKLLRVLTALDYLFDPNRNGGKTKPAADNGKPTAEGSKQNDGDILTTLYENPTFGSLWNKLSESLSAIRQGDGVLNIATILLPLIEALMVVCKNTTLKDVPLIKAAKEFSIASPPPESFMESLFFRFTEDHRKILNDLVRHNPKLMSGTFSLLVKNPKVLEFDNKRNYFTRRLHSRGTEARHAQPPLQLSVRRDQVFLDSFKFLSFKSGDEIKYGKLNIRFHGEEGVDAGGVTREWFQVLSRQMFNPDYALFIPVASDRTTFHPNKLSKVNDEHLMFFKFIGRIIGKALYEGRALDCHFSRAVYKRILGKTVSIKDMETLDLEYYKSLIWMLENDITEIITETFSVETDDFGVTEIVDLVENGRNIPVTEENKHEYVQLVVEYRLTGSVHAQLEQFLKGFHDIVSPELIAIFNEQELELLISGLPDIDVDDWKNHTEYHNYQAASSQIQWFWRAVRSFDKEERAKLLQFVTGTSKVPLNGFDQLEGMNGFSRFNIHRDYGTKDRLPSSHTCFNQLDLPEYDSYEQLRQQVYTAMTAGSEYFGFA